MQGVKFYNSLRFKVAILAIIIAALPALIVYLVYANVTRRVIMEKYTQTAVQSVYEVGRNIDLLMTGLIEYSDIILTSQDFLTSIQDVTQFNSASFSAMMRNYYISREDIDGLYVYSSMFDRSNYFGVSKTDPTEYKDDPQINDSNGEIVWLNTKQEKIKILSGQFDKNYFTFARKIIDLNSLRYLGVLAIDLEEQVLTSASAGLLSESEAQVFMISDEQTIISASDKNLIGTPTEGMAYMSGLSKQKASNGYYLFNDGSEEMISIYAFSPVTDWVIVKTVPTRSLYTEIITLEKALLYGMLGFAVFSLLLAMIASRFFTRPIMQLAQSMRGVEKGDLSIRVKKLRKDELGQLGTSFNYMIAEMNQLIDRLILKERQKKEIEMEVLRAQINPHFLYNTLNTISWMAKIRGAENISEAIAALIKLLRVSINLGKDNITLDEEIEYVKNYCLIQQLRFNNHFEISYDIEAKAKACTIPKLILQPIVENSLIYGSEQHSGNYLCISICARLINSDLEIVVTDNGPGIDSKRLETIFAEDPSVDRLSKVGLNNVHQRIQLNYGAEYGLAIESKPGEGTEVIIHVPCIYNLTEAKGEQEQVQE
ncbi:MAG: sensor histidine kinase [Clostridiaceae bacterium]|nr:sensor histidine kinase [Clostridiaceae bacterium]